MHVLDQVRLIIYRCHEKGLEVFLVNTGFEEENWKIPFEEIAKYPGHEFDHKIIPLDPLKENDGSMTNVVAVEGDWHDIPSLRKLVRGDVKIVASKIKFIADHGAFFAMKEALKKVLPNEYAVLHELKEILMARNQLQNI
ncbi:MAG TPA: hypothetical protein VI603_16610 [Saprospiraceae bacterium]|nr:hypothetical protein [Saprospiraceae bacterium]